LTQNRPVDEGGGDAIGLDGPPQEASRSHNVLLAHKLRKISGPDAVC